MGSCHFVGGLEEGSGPPHGVQVPESMSGERQRKAEEGGGVAPPTPVALSGGGRGEGVREEEITVWAQWGLLNG